MDVLKPYLLLAGVAFFIGFASYLAMARWTMPPADLRVESYQAPIQASAPDAPLTQAKVI